MSFDMNSPNPYAASTQPTAPKKSNVLLYVLLGIGGVLLLTCCGCGGVIWYGWNTGMSQISAAVAKIVRPSLQADPVIQEQIGELQSVEWELGSLVEETKKDPKRHQGRNMALRVKGPKGEGIVIGRFDQTGPDSGDLKNAELLKGGTWYPLSD